MNELLKIFNKDDLYKRSGWFSKDCEELIVALERLGLCIVDKDKLESLVNYLYRLEDDMR